MHSFVSCLMHCVFSTKERRRLINPEIQSRPYLSGIARENKMKMLSIGGVEDPFICCYRFPQLCRSQSRFNF
jgi:putative transposase